MRKSHQAVIGKGVKWWLRDTSDMASIPHNMKGHTTEQ